MYILDMPTDYDRTSLGQVALHLARLHTSDEAVELILLRTLESAVRAAGPAITSGQRIALAGLDSLRDEIAKRAT